MPLPTNYANTVPQAVESVPEVDEGAEAHRGPSAVAAGQRRGRPLIPAVRQLPRPAAGNAPSAAERAHPQQQPAAPLPPRAQPPLAALPQPKRARPNTGNGVGGGVQGRRKAAAPPLPGPPPKRPPPASSTGARDLDFSNKSVQGSRGFRFSFKSFTWGDTAVNHVSLDPEVPIIRPKLPWQDRPWYANLRPLAVPVVVAYVAISIAYIVIRAKDSIKGISAPAYGWVVLSAEILGMVSLLQAAINHVYKVDWATAPFMGAEDPKYRVRVLVPCYKEDVDVLRLTITRAVRALHIGANAVAEGHVYLCDDAPKHAKAPSGGTFREERATMMGVGSSAASMSLRNLARGEPSSPLHHKVTLHHQPRHKGDGPSDEGLVNNKAMNTNHCVGRIAKGWTNKTGRPFNEDGLEIFAILDADQAIVDNSEDDTVLNEVVEPSLRPGKSLAFFADLLPYFIPDSSVAIVQTPQVFRGCLLGTDILNHRNIDFWSHQQPAYNIRHFISCAGTNFLIRASAFIEAGGFPLHTLTEDFALGQELMRRGYRGVYVEKAYVLGEAPDVLRIAVGQRSRWCKGAFQMLVSLRGLRSLFGLKNPRLIWLYIFPCYNYIVSGLSTPLFMVIPIVFIFSGAFPALLTADVIGVAAAYFVLTLSVQYFPRFDRGHAMADMLAHWNADVATKNFWFMFIKSALRGPLPKCNEGVSRWKSGSDKDADGWRDVIPHITFLLAYAVSIIWAGIQFSQGAAFSGPLGLSLLWCLYQSLPPFLLVLHRCMKIRHKVSLPDGATKQQQEKAKRLWRVQHNVYTCINISAMLASLALGIAILSVAISTAGSATAGGAYQGQSPDPTGQSKIYYFTPKQLVKALG